MASLSRKDILRRFQRKYPNQFCSLEGRRFLTLLLEQEGKFAPAAFFADPQLEDELDWDPVINVAETDPAIIVSEHVNPLFPELKEIKNLRLVKMKWKHYWVTVVMHVYKPRPDYLKLDPIMILCDEMMSTKIVNENAVKKTTLQGVRA